MVVLVNGASASASEIVAGALSAHQRAVIVGQTTFGKGTVQLVFPRVTPDGAALKLTIAQYLTPGSVSIQGVGVTPDIELDPMTADELEMDLFRTESLLRERDLSKSLNNQAARPRSRGSFLKLRYHLTQEERNRIRDLGEELDDEFRVDFAVEFARELVSRLPGGGVKEQLATLQGFLEKTQRMEISEIAERLSEMGIDWGEPSAPNGAGSYDVSVTTDRPNNEVVAGEAMNLRIAVTNTGTTPVYQLRASTESDNGYFDEKELVFGRVDPGQTVTAAVPLGWCEFEGYRFGSTAPLPEDAKRLCRIPKDAVTRQDPVKVHFYSEGSEPPSPEELRLSIRSLPQPVFAYSFQVQDDRPGNGDGQLARGEGATMHLTVKNVGNGASYETQANLRNITGSGLLLNAGRFDVSNMAPGDVRRVAFTFDVLPELDENFVKVELSVADRDLGVVSSEKVTIPVTRSGLFIREASGSVAVRAEGSMLRGQPVEGARVFGRLARGAVVQRVGDFGTFTKVRLGPDRFGFVATADVEDSSAPATTAWEPALTRSPPLLEVHTGSLATSADRVRIQVSATDSDGVLDAFVFVGARKVLYSSNRRAEDATRLTVDQEVLLSPGVNIITVVTRETEDTATRYTGVVRRDGPNGEALPTPKLDLFGADWEFAPAEAGPIRR
jgi:carboxyl-terminal processing protease